MSEKDDEASSESTPAEVETTEAPSAGGTDGPAAPREAQASPPAAEEPTEVDPPMDASVAEASAEEPTDVESTVVEDSPDERTIEEVPVEAPPLDSPAQPGAVAAVAATQEASPPPPADPNRISVASAVLVPGATPSNPPTERVIVQGPRGTALVGVPKPDLEGDESLGPRGTAVMGVGRPQLGKTDDVLPAFKPGSLRSERTSSHSFSNLARTERNRIAQAILGAVVGLLLAGGLGSLILFLVLKEDPEPAPAATATQPAPTVAPAPPPAPTVSASAAPTGADADAIVALEQLKAAVESCMKKLKQMPGTSPSVPRTIAAMTNGSYQPSPRDFNGPFFNCTRFRLEKPMPFIIQWQYRAAEKKGVGIAWLDPDGDGKPDKAWAFTATSTGKDSADFGPIGPIDASTKLERPLGGG